MEKNPTPRSDFFMPGSESQQSIQKEKQTLQAVRQRITLQAPVEAFAEVVVTEGHHVSRLPGRAKGYCCKYNRQDRELTDPTRRRSVAAGCSAMKHLASSG